MNAVAAPSPAPSAPPSPPALDALLSARTVWRAGRAAPAAPDGEPTGHGALDALLPWGGWPRAALTELLLPADGVGELALLLPALARLTQAGGIVALVAPPYLPYAPAWQAAGVDLRHLEVIEAEPRGALWAFEQCLRSAACAAVLGWPLQADAQALRRLQVAADSGDCLGFAFRDAKHAVNPPPPALRLEYVAAGAAGNAWPGPKSRAANVPPRAFAGPRAWAGPGPGLGSAVLWACIALPRLALDAVLRRMPDPSRPLALVSGPAQLRHLHAVNAGASDAGLKPGMRLSAAHALLSDVAMVEYEPASEARWQRFLAAWAYRHSSQVSAQWRGAIVFEARASFRLFGPWPRFEARLRAELDGLGFSHRIALAPTPRAALV